MTLTLGQWQWVIDGPATFVALAMLVVATVWAIFAAWRRLGRESRGRWAMVAWLNLGASIALAALLAPPERPAPPGAVARLVTAGASLPAAPGGRTFATLTADAGTDAPEDVTRLAHVGQLPLRGPDIDRLQVTGHGLSEAEWAALPGNWAVDFTPPPLEGVTEPAWPRRLQLGEPLTVTGVYRAPQPDTVATVSLIDPAGVTVDRSSVRAGATFELEDLPPSHGLHTYRLLLERGDETLADDPVPVEVTGGGAVTLGVVQSAPSFETRQLQHWAGAQGSRLQVITQISRDRHIRQAINSDPDAFEFSPAWLDDLDLLVVDGRSWTEFDARRRQWIGNAVRGGLGLLLLADTGVAFEGLLDGFTLAESDTTVDEAVPVVDGHESEIALPLLGRRLVASGASSLTKDDNGTLLEAWVQHGLGRVAVSILRERHRWHTAGRGDVYTAYWAGLMRTIGRPQGDAMLLTPSPTTLLRERIRHRACARTVPGYAPGSLRWSPVIVGDRATETRLPMATNPVKGQVACVAFWPWATGWHRAEHWVTGDDAPVSTGHEYVFAQDEWRSASAYARQQATRARVDANPAGGGGENTGGRPRVPLGPTGPWWIFVICALLLWLERKQFNLRSVGV